MLRDLDQFRIQFDEAGIEVVVGDVKERLSEDELLPFAGQIDGALCGDDAFTARFLEEATPRLKIIAKWGTGMDTIDMEAAKRFGVKVTNTPDAFTEAVADSVLGYILTFARELPWMDRDVKAGIWKKRRARSLHETTLGVVGVGRIGKAVLARAHGFGMRLLGNDIVETAPDFLSTYSVSMLELDKLLRESDFVSLNCDLNPSSKQLIDVKALSIMKSEAVLINTSRGRVVDQVALVAALEQNQIAGAALDVFEDEPIPTNSRLLAMDNVMLAPHNANSSPMAWDRVHLNSLNNLFEGLGLGSISALLKPEASSK